MRDEIVVIIAIVVIAAACSDCHCDYKTEIKDHKQGVQDYRYNSRDKRDLCEIRLFIFPNKIKNDTEDRDTEYYGNKKSL